MESKFKINDLVLEKKTGIRGYVADLDLEEELPIGVWFEDDDTTIWWMKEKDIKLI